MSTPALGAAISGERLWRRHVELARHGETPAGGVNRPALSDAEIGARRQLIDWARAADLAVWTDPAGNLFLALVGHEPDRPAVLTGSHIDSQPTGGKFDGAYGVLAGLEVLEAMRDAGVTPRRTIGVVAWMNEEASRFAPGMMGSQAFAGTWDLDAILKVRDGDGVSVREALQRVRTAEPDVPVKPLGLRVEAFLEAHIEQGPRLKEAGVPVGVVTGIQGTRRYRVRYRGEAGHAGTTPSGKRRDAGLAAVRAIARLAERAQAEPDLMFTVGLLRLTPNAPSVIPAEAFFAIDVRHPDDAVVAAFDREIAVACRVAAGPCEVEVRCIAHAPSLLFPGAIRRRLHTAAQRAGHAAMDIYSAAGHDARHLHAVCPTGMLFVPCHNGISHSEAEWTEPVHLTAGAQVLAETLLDLAENGAARE